MTFINNPLGSGGFNPQALPDITAGVQAVQQLELQQTLRDVEQGKIDAAQNEKDFLKNMSFDRVNFMRRDVQDRVLAKQKEHVAKWTTTFRGQKDIGGKLSLEQKLEQQREREDILGEIDDANRFVNTFDSTQKQMMGLIAKASPDEAERLKTKWNEFNARLETDKDLTELDIIDTLTPGEVPVFESYNTFDDEVMKFKGAMVPTAGGGTKLNKQILKEGIRGKLEANSHIMEIGQKAGNFNTIEEGVEFFANRNIPKFEAKGDRAGAQLTEKERREQPREIESFTFSTGNKSAGTAYNYNGKEVDVSLPKSVTDQAEGMVPGAYKVTLIGGDSELTEVRAQKIGKKEVELTTDEEKKEARRTALFDTKSRIVTRKDGTQYLETKTTESVTLQIPTEDFKGSLPKGIKFDKVVKFTPEQESGISVFMKTNNLSREEAISILKENKRL
jgi:hypothetical protein